MEYISQSSLEVRIPSWKFAFPPSVAPKSNMAALHIKLSDRHSKKENVYLLFQCSVLNLLHSLIQPPL